MAITKWRTQRDGLVCPSCAALDGLETSRIPPNPDCESDGGECRCVAEMETEVELTDSTIAHMRSQREGDAPPFIVSGYMGPMEPLDSAPLWRVVLKFLKLCAASPRGWIVKQWDEARYQADNDANRR